MRILAIDPGATTGWVVRDAGVVVDAGHFRGDDVPAPWPQSWHHADLRIIERPKGYGPTRPEVVDCAWVAGRLAERLSAREITRLQVCQALTDAVHGVVRVRNDPTAWAALKVLHGGEGCDRKGKNPGPLGIVTAHARAALAAAVAWDWLHRDETGARRG